MLRHGEEDFTWIMKKFKPPFAPRMVVLFSGHMIDAPSRAVPRFPAHKEPAAAAAITSRLEALKVGSEDIGLCSGACGGDILFAEACLRLGVFLEVRIPFDEPTFLKYSVTFARGTWHKRYDAITHNTHTNLLIMPEVFGPTPHNADPYERNNLWLLHTAISLGPKVHFICLWDGKSGDGPGGTKHMHDEVLQNSGQVYVIDTNTL